MKQAYLLESENNVAVVSFVVLIGQYQLQIFPRVETGSNTSTVALRVVGGEEKESHESETVKYGYESHGTRTRE
jgi:hypothetical protein